jgi:TolA-binding protein
MLTCALAARTSADEHVAPPASYSAPPADSAGPLLQATSSAGSVKTGTAGPGRNSNEVPALPPATAKPETPDQAAGAPKVSPETTEAVKPPDASGPVSDARKEIVGLQTLGASLTERGDWDAAEIAFRQVLASPAANKADLGSALIGLARVYRRQGTVASLTKAAAIYERYLVDYSSSDQAPDVLLELGRTHRALGAHQLALARFYSVINSTLKLSPDNFGHYQMLAKTAQFEIAETHFQQGNYTEASKYFSRLRLLDLAPADRARAHFKAAYAQYLGKDLEGAVATLRSFLEQCPQDENVPEASYLLALSLRSLGRKQEALDATLQLLRTAQANADPKRWAYWQRRTGNQLANDFFQSGDTLNALAIYQGLAALSPEVEWRLPVTYQIGLCYERMRVNDRAAAAYQSIIDNANPPPAAAASPSSGTATAETSKPAAAELTELARMAAWRLGQITWHDQTERQLSSIFSSGTPPAAPKQPPAPHSVAPNIDTNAPSQPTVLPAHDQAGNPATAPASL